MTPTSPQPSAAHRPRVGIPWRTSQEELSHTTKKLQYYFDCVEAASAEAIGISLYLPPDQRAALIRSLDAFVLPGAPSDVDPGRYRAVRHPKTNASDENREHTDYTILKHALANAKPVLAICYGCQMLNVCLGGTLYQDIASELQTTIEHSRAGLSADSLDPRHSVRIEFGSRLAQVASSSGLPKRDGGFAAEINTSHHQSVRDLGNGLRVAAVAPDGVIEAIEHEPHKHWVVGVQWHPERMPDDPLAQRLFEQLVTAAASAPNTLAHKT
jgi:putative glutamine amidotransferase